MSNLKKNPEFSFVEDIKQIIEQAKVRIAISVNAEITQVYWQVGNRIKKEILNDKRADYGEEIIKKLAKC